MWDPFDGIVPGILPEWRVEDRPWWKMIYGTDDDAAGAASSSCETDAGSADDHAAAAAAVVWIWTTGG